MLLILLVAAAIVCGFVFSIPALWIAGVVVGAIIVLFWLLALLGVAVAATVIKKGRW